MEKNYKTKKEEMKNEKTAGNAVVFENPEFGKILTQIDENGEPLFCAKDVCNALGYKNLWAAIQRHVDDPYIAKRDVWVVTGKKKDGVAAKRLQQMLFVNESGFYALVLGSKLPTAVKFKNWVTSEVLPQIRKTGGYIPVKQGESDEETIRHAEEILRATLKEKENERLDMQKRLLPILHKYNNVAIYACGHIHNFQHIQKKGDNIDYVVNSSSSLARSVKPIDGTVFCSPADGFSVFTADKKQLRMSMIDKDGKIIHTVLKVKK